MSERAAATSAKAARSTRAAACCWSGGPRLHACHSLYAAAHRSRTTDRPTNQPPDPTHTARAPLAMYLCAALEQRHVTYRTRARLSLDAHPQSTDCKSSPKLGQRGWARRSVFLRGNHRMNYAFNNYSRLVCLIFPFLIPK